MNLGLIRIKNQLRQTSTSFIKILNIIIVYLEAIPERI